MVRNDRKYPWFLGIRRYEGICALGSPFFKQEIIKPAETKVKELEIARLSALAEEV
jgi:hypothetical protein